MDDFDMKSLERNGNNHEYTTSGLHVCHQLQSHLHHYRPSVRAKFRILSNKCEIASYTVSSLYAQGRAGICRNRDCENSVASFYDSKHHSPILHEGKELNQPGI